MNSQEIADKIIDLITSWSKESDHLVVGIDGIPGVGKSTILNLMNGKVDALLVHMDDFLTPIEHRQSLVDSGAEPEEFVAGLFDLDDIRSLVKDYRKGQKKEFKTLAYKSGRRQIETTYDFTKPVLVMEGTYMFHPKYFNNLWDKRIYLDGDEEEIRERRINRTKQMMGVDFIPEDDPRSFFNISLKALKEYQNNYKPKEQADIVFKINPN